MMNMRLKKAISDIRHAPGRFSMVILALVVGIWGVGSILVSYYVLSQDLTRNYLNTLPAHAILTSHDFHKLDMAALRARAEIEEAEFRDLSIQRIEVSPDQWIPLWLYGVNDFSHMRLARITPEQGAIAAQQGSLLLERDGLRISNLDRVKRPRLRLPSGVVHVPISGIVFDPAQAPATQDHLIYAYTDQQTFANLIGAPGNQRLILRFKGVTSKEAVERAVAQLTEALAIQGIHLSRIEIPAFNQHPHQWQLDTLMLLQGGISLLAFAMAAVLVSQLMSALLSKQIRQIGVLKAIGGSRAQVMQIYAFMVLVVGVIAGLIGIPLALLSGYGFSYFVAYALNFNILTTQLPWTLYLAIVAISLLLPLALSLPILSKGSRISVRDALSDYGIKVHWKKSKMRSLQRMPRSLVMAFRNTLRQKKRLSITMLTMALGVAIFSTGFNVRQSLVTLLQETSDTMRYDVRVVLKKPISASKAQSLFSQMGNVRQLEFWNGGHGELQTRGVSGGSGTGIVALPQGSELLKPKIVQGQWLQGQERAEMVMNLQAWEQSNFPPIGGRRSMLLEGRQVEMTLVGLVEEFEKPKIYIDQQYYFNAVNSDRQANSIMFAAKNTEYEAVVSLKQEIERRLAATNLPVLEVMSHAERMKIIYDHLNIVLSVLLFFAFTVLLVSALGMSSAMGISIMERTREIGVLRAIGATPAKVFRLFETEGMLLSVASILLGLLLSWPLSRMAAAFFGDLMLGGADLRFVVSGQGLLITLITTLLFGWMASRIPARNALKVTTHQALAYE